MNHEVHARTVASEHGNYFVHHRMATFRKVYVEITNVCDRACSFCAGHSRQPTFMHPGDFSRVLTHIEGRTGVLHLHVMGEPLIHPGLDQILDQCQSAAMRVNLVTSGYHLSRWAPALTSHSCVRQLSISTQSAESLSETQLIDYANDISSLARSAVLSGTPRISIRFWAADGHRELPAMRAIERAFGCDRPIADLLRESNSAQLAPGVWCNRAPRFDWPSLDHPVRASRGSCLGLRGQLAVLADGTVVPCCLDRNGAIALGNLLHEPLDTILASPRARALREGFSRGELTENLCRRCAYRERFVASAGNR